MPIPKRWSKLSKVENAPKKPGVYELGNREKTIVKIGEGKKLKERLSQQMPSIPKDVKFIRWQEIKQHEKREKQMLEEFKEKHGRLPKYNEQIG